MAGYVLVSSKGSPGVTTAATALAAAATTIGTGLVVELDPSGGSIVMLARGAVRSGLVEAAGQLRREPSRAAVVENTATVPPGVPTLVAPTSATHAAAVIGSLGGRWMGALNDCAGSVLVDAGRWDTGQATGQRVVGSDLVVLVCRPTLESVESARHMVDNLREAARQKVAVLVVGGRPYRPEDIAAHLQVPLVGSIAWDLRGVSTLWAKGVSKMWLRTRLARSAVRCLHGLGMLSGASAQLQLPATTGEVPAVSASPSDQGAFRGVLPSSGAPTGPGVGRGPTGPQPGSPSARGPEPGGPAMLQSQQPNGHRPNVAGPVGREGDRW